MSLIGSLRQRIGRGRLSRAGYGLALLALAAAPAAQQAPVDLQHLEVALWPEFDRPAVLVIYRFELAPTTPLPARLALPIPAGTGELHALAYVDPEGQLLNIEDRSFQTQDGWTTVLFSTLGQQGQLEYYADLVRSGDQRSFQFDWPGGVNLDSFGFEVQQPPTAVDFAVVPAPSNRAAGENGLTHLFGTLQPTGPEWTTRIELSYQKADALLSADSLQAPEQQPALGQLAPPAGGLDLQTALPWALGGLGVVLLGAGVFWYLRLSRPAPARAKQERRPPRQGRKGGAEIEASPIYCHNCGTRAGASDVFCRQCGTKLRGR